MENKTARQNFKALLQGKPARRELSLAEAKARLRAADPQIDISDPLKYFSQGRMKEAGLSLAVETAATVTLPYLRPAVTASLFGFHALLTGKKTALTRGR